MNYEYMGLQGNWQLYENDAVFFLKNYFDYEIDGLDQDEMRCGEIVILLDKESKIDISYFDDEYDYRQVTSEVSSIIQEEGIIEAVHNFLQAFPFDEPMEFINGVCVDTTRKGTHILFEIKGNFYVYNALVADQEIKEVTTLLPIGEHDEALQVDVLFDHPKLIEYFYHHSKERIKLLFQSN